MDSTEDYNQIMSDRKMFNDVVYTPLSEAIKILEERRSNPEIVKKIDQLLKGDIPEVLKNNNNCGVMCRQITSPNYDVRSFVSITLDNNLKPVFFEYPEDKFISDNEFKHSLGQLRIHGKIDKIGNFIEEKINIIDFNKSNGKKMNEVFTLKGQSLLDFHRSLFEAYKINHSDIYFIDGSDWVKNNGKKASEYYYNLFLIFVCNGILFENFMMNGTEGDFSKEKVLPAIEKIIKETGLKPLIVPIPPMDLEEDGHWLSHESIIKDYLITH